MEKNSIDLKTILPAGTIYRDAECKRRFAIGAESFDGAKADEAKSHPERFPVFEIDFSGLTLETVLGMAFGRTALVDSARQEFRDKDATQAADFRAKFEKSPNGNPILAMKAEELAGLKLPKSDAEKLADAQATLSKLLANGMDPAQLAKLLGLS